MSVTRETISMAQRSQGGSGESGHSGEADGENFSEGEQFTTTGVGYRRGRAIRLGRRGGALIRKGDTSTHIMNLLRKEATRQGDVTRRHGCI